MKSEPNARYYPVPGGNWPFNSFHVGISNCNKFLYKEDLTKEGLKLYSWDISKPIDPEIKYEALNKFNIKDWPPFEDALEQAEEENNAEFDLTREQEFEALENAGVDNWGWYAESIQDYKETHCKVPDVTDKEFIENFEEIPKKEEWNNYKDYVCNSFIFCV